MKKVKTLVDTRDNVHYNMHVCETEYLPRYRLSNQTCMMFVTNDPQIVISTSKSVTAVIANKDARDIP